jgi:nucleotide-binding universal stress UspA family protein
MKFLAAYSGTSQSKAVLDLARRHAKIFDATLVVISSSEGGSGENLDELNRVKSELEAVRREMAGEGLSCEVELLARGLSPAEDIVRFAADNQIDHIFVGIQKKSRTRKLLLGSTAQYVILKSDCPVTTVK